MTAFPNEPVPSPSRFTLEYHTNHSAVSTSPACELRLSLHTIQQQITVQHRIPHIRQMHHCIWTVDLAFLLRRFGLEVTITTITVGINPAFARETFYQDTLEEDALRIQQLFIEASRAGVVIRQRSVSSEDLQALVLSGGYLLVVLLDKRRLSPWLAAADMCLPALCGLDMGYMGHYVVVSGFDPQRQEFLVQDPAASTSTLRVAASVMDEARKSFGTDEDLLLIAVPPAIQQQLTACSAACLGCHEVPCCLPCSCCSK